MALIASYKEIFLFFLRQERRARRTKIFLLLGMVPALILVITKIIELTTPDPEVTAAQVFSRAILIVFIQFMIPVLTLLYGSMVVNEEVDHKTMVFLGTAPIPKPAVVLGKFSAYAVVTAVIINAGLIMCFLVVNIDRLNKMVNVKSFFSFIGAGTLALIAYLALFTLMGSLMKKSIVVGILVLGWENIVQYFPGVTQKFTIIHWIKSMLPRVADGDTSLLKVLVFRLEASSPIESLAVLMVFTAAVLAAACWVFQNKEYIISDSD